MTHVVSFRPGVAQEQSAFEGMAKIYRHLSLHYGYDFTILTSESDTFSSDVLDVVSIPDSAWKSSLPRFPLFPRRLSYRRHIDDYVRSADLVLTLDPTAYPQGSLAISRAAKADTPVFIDASATLNGDLPLFQLLKRPLERRSLRRCDRILVTVPKTIERFRDRQLYDESLAPKFDVMGHPVDVSTFRPEDADTQGPVSVLTISRLVPEKGLIYVIEAMEPLLKRRPDVEFNVLGTGPMKGHLEKVVERKGIADSVSFLGTVPHDEVPAVLNRHDVFVNHAVGNSHWEEFFGVANLEAMACGLACVVSDSGGIPYAIRRENVAEFVTQRDIVGLRRTLRDLIDDEEYRAEMGALAREYVRETYATEVIGSRYHELVQETIGDAD